MEGGSNTRAVQDNIEIEASPERVWRALTEAAELVRWFPLDARVEPGEGGSIFMSWRNEFAGESRILAWEPPRRLAISWGWEETGGQPQVTEYRLEGGGGRTVVKVVTSGFPADPSWDGWVEGTRRGWRFELRSLKEYLEHHAGAERDVVYLRHRTPATAADAWERLLGEEGAGTELRRGRAFDDEPRGQYAAVLDELDGGLLRVSVEPTPVDVDAREIVLWAQAWGDARPRLPELEAQWRALLGRLFPGGRTL